MTEQIEPSPSKEEKAVRSRTIALVLSFVFPLFSGGLIHGIHRFYMGYTFIGVIQLITFGGCGIWSIVDAFNIGHGKLKAKGKFEWEESNF